MKVGKEEAIGMLAAVEQWVRRDHDGEWKRWTGWLELIAGRVGALDGVRASIVQPKGLSNRTPSLEIRWARDSRRMSGGDDRADVVRHRAADLARFRPATTTA